MSYLDKTIEEVFAEMADMNAALCSMKVGSEDGADVAAIICVAGEEETADVTSAVKFVQDGWHNEDRETPRKLISDLLARAYGPEDGVPPELARKALRYTGEHRVLVDTRYGQTWISPSDAETYDNEEQRDQILDEINGDDFSHALS